MYRLAVGSPSDSQRKWCGWFLLSLRDGRPFASRVPPTMWGAIVRWSLRDEDEIRRLCDRYGLLRSGRRSCYDGL